MLQNVFKDLPFLRRQAQLIGEPHGAPGGALHHIGVPYKGGHQRPVPAHPFSSHGINASFARVMFHGKMILSQRQRRCQCAGCGASGHRTAMPTDRMTMCSTSIMARGFQMYFTQVVYSMRQMAMAPIRVPLVGVMPFISAQAPLSTHTMISGTRPRFWARGPMMGMDTVARLEEEGMSTDSSRYTPHRSSR